MHYNRATREFNAQFVILLRHAESSLNKRSVYLYIYIKKARSEKPLKDFIFDSSASCNRRDAYWNRSAGLSALLPRDRLMIILPESPIKSSIDSDWFWFSSCFLFPSLSRAHARLHKYYRILQLRKGKGEE